MQPSFLTQTFVCYWTDLSRDQLLWSHLNHKLIKCYLMLSVCKEQWTFLPEDREEETIGRVTSGHYDDDFSLFRNKLKIENNVVIRPQLQSNWVTFQDLFVTRYSDNLRQIFSWLLLPSLSFIFALNLLVKLINVLKNRQKL